jgi:transcription antitermination factor NusG
LVMSASAAGLDGTKIDNMSEQWYALRVKPHKERTVHERLAAEAVEGYLPLVKVRPKNPRAAKLKPYFPGYLFVRADLKHLGANKLKWMPGTIGLVEFGGVPAVVPANLVQEIKDLLVKINKQGGLDHFELQAGDPVRIVSGPFAGYEAIFDARVPGKDRVQVLLAFLSQSPQPLELDAATIKKIGK